MRFDTLARQFTAKYPNGTIAKMRSSVCVQFAVNGKPYHYRDSNYGIAERLDLIPASDMHEIAARVARALVDGAAEVVDESGASDTIRALHQVNAWEDAAGTDEFDRPLSRYTIATNDGWTS